LINPKILVLLSELGGAIAAVAPP